MAVKPHDYGFLDGIRIRALAGVMDPDEEYALRDIFRWYSREFSTKLHEVEGLPLEFILLNWFEVQFQELDEDEQLALSRELVETPEERAARIAHEKRSDDAFLQRAQARNDKKSKQGLLKKMLDKQIAKAKATQDLVEPKYEEVVVKYVSTGDMEAELDRELGPPPRSSGKKLS
jgi:hypothetical protein